MINIVLCNKLIKKYSESKLTTRNIESSNFIKPFDVPLRSVKRNLHIDFTSKKIVETLETQKVKDIAKRVTI